MPPKPKPIKLHRSVDNIHVSSPDEANSPVGLTLMPNFISQSQESKIIDVIDADVSNPWVYVGFQVRRRKKDYKLNNSNILGGVLDGLLDVLQELSGPQLHKSRPNTLRIEELLSGTTTPNTFQHYSAINDNAHSSSSYQQEVLFDLSLGGDGLMNYERPLSRKNDCWDCSSSNIIYIPQRSLLVRHRESLMDFRSHVVTPHDVTITMDEGDKELCGENKEKYRRIRLRFMYLPEDYSANEVIQFDDCRSNDDSTTSEVNGREDLNVDFDLKDFLTIIVTTSPIKSNPSIELLEQTFDTFKYAGHEFAYACKKIIVCDGYRRQDHDNSVTRKYTTPKQAMRNGIVNEVQEINYNGFKERLQEHVSASKNNLSSSFQNTELLELTERHGYGYALREALKYVTTKYVCVIQHDRTFMRSTPVKDVVNAMRADSSRIKYVGISMRSNLMYRDIFMAKFGREAYDIYSKDMCLRPPQLKLSSKLYGENVSISNMGTLSEKVRKSIHAFSDQYWKSIQGLEYRSHLEEEKAPQDGTTQLSLVGSLYWYDNTHIAQTDHYRDFIFHPEYKMVAKGGFIEDKVSPCLLKSVEKLGLIRGHGKFGCYLLDDHSGTYFTGHLDGGNFLTKVEKENFTNKD